MSRFLETSRYLTELNSLWDKHASHILKANTALETMLTTASRIPSTYMSSMKNLDAVMKNLIKSMNELNSTTKNHTKEITALINKRNALINSSKQLATAITQLEEKLKKANAQLSIMRDKIISAGNEQVRAKAKILELENQVNRLTTRLNASSTAMNTFTRTSRVGLGMVTQLMAAFGIQQGLFLAVDIAKNIFKTTKELQSLDLALKMVSGTQSEFVENQAFISNVAEKWGIEIKGLTQQYTQFYTASKGILSTAKIKEVFESVAKSGALMGLSVEKQSAAFYAFEQMMSKGVVASEELKKQLGNAMPGAMKAAGMAYMELHPKIKTIQEAEAALMKDMKAGAIDSATYVPLIVKNFEKLYGIEMINKVDTLQASQERLVNSWTELVRSMNENPTGGISAFFVFLLSNTNTLIKELARLNSSWDNLYEKAKNRGAASGEQAANERFEQGGNSLSGANASLTVARRELLRIKSELLAVQIEGEKATKYVEENKFRIGVALYTGSDVKKLREQKEILLEDFAFQSAIIKQTKKLKSEIGATTADVKKPLTKGELKELEKASKEKAKLIEEANKQEYELGLSNLNNEKFIIEQKMLLKTNNFSENIRLAAELGVKEQEIAKFVYDEEIRLAGSSNSKRIIADNKYYQEKIKLAKSYLDRINSVEFKPQYKDKNKVADQETYGSGVFETNEDTLKEMKDAWNEQQNEKDKIAKREEERLKAMRDVLNDIFKEFGEATGFEKTMDMFAKIGKNGKTFWENLLGVNGGALDLKEGLIAGLTLTQDIGNKIAEGNQTRYEEQLTRLENMKEFSLEMVGDNEAAKAKIEEDYQKKHDEITRKQAKSKKQQALFNIAIDTAQAIMGLWVKPGFPAAIPLAIAVGALGAMQLAMVASKPLPSFYTGTDYAPEGYANTDEHGAEIHTDKYGNIKDFGSNTGPRIKYLNEGDKIIPAKRTADILGLNDFSSLDEILSINGILYNDNKNIQLDVSEIVSGLDSIKQTILNKETSEEYYDERGWTKYKKINGQKVEDKNNRIRFKKSII